MRPLAIVMAAMSSAEAASGSSFRVDSHLHLWTTDVHSFPYALSPKNELLDGRATHENFIKLMDQAEIAQAVVVQPVNYDQDYSYITSAMEASPGRLFGMFVARADFAADEEAVDWIDHMARSNPGWVGVRFNPLKWPPEQTAGMADKVGKAMFQRAGELGLVVGFMPFKGLSQHMAEITKLLAHSPQTKVIIDHWGFFLQPADGFSEHRQIIEDDWKCLKELGANYPQVFVKISAFFRVASDPWPFTSLSERLQELVGIFGSQRLLWGSDFPYATEFSDYYKAARTLEEWPMWQEMSKSIRDNILGGTAARVFKLPTSASRDPETEL